MRTSGAVSAKLFNCRFKEPIISGKRYVSVPQFLIDLLDYVFGQAERYRDSCQRRAALERRIAGFAIHSDVIVIS